MSEKFLSGKKKSQTNKQTYQGKLFLFKTFFYMLLHVFINISLSFAQNFVIFMLIWPYYEIFEILRCKFIIIFIFLLNH